MKKSLTFLFLLSFLKIQAQDAYHTKLLDSLNKKFALPNTAKWILPNTETGTLAIVGNYGGTTTTISPSNTIFTTAQQRIISQGNNPWDAGHTYKNETAIAKGDRLLIVFWIRSWLGNAPIYNVDWTLKPSGTAFIDQVFTKCWTDTKANTGATGEASQRAFKGRYKITVKLADGKTVSQIVDLDQDKTITINANSTGINDLVPHFNLKILPNPTTFPVKITWNPQALNDMAEIQIRNNIGVVVFDKKVNFTEGGIEWEGFQKASGIYFVTLKTSRGLQTQKLVVP